MAEPKAVPTATTEANRAAAAVCRLAQRAVEDDRPLFLVVFYRHEGEKLDFLAAVRQGLRQRGLQNRTLDPGRNPDHGTGKLYSLLAADGDETIHLVTDLARGDDGAFDPAFLDYLNLHRDRINREKLRWVLVLHDSEAEPFLRQAGDLWDFRQRTFWLERPEEPRGETLWQDLGERMEGLPLGEEERQEIEEHLATVRQQVEATSDPEERAGLLLDLARWLLPRHAAGAAVEVTLEGLGLLEDDGGEIRLDLELVAAIAMRKQNQAGEALRHLEQALGLAARANDQGHAATTLNEIGEIYYGWGRYEDALQCFQRSLAICEDLRGRTGEARALNNIAQVYKARGRNEDALQHLQQSLRIDQDVGDRAGEATALNNIASIYHSLGRNKDALQHFQQSLLIRQEVGDRVHEARTLGNIAQIFHAWGRDEEALQHLQQSLEITKEVGDRRGEATTLNNIASIHLTWGRFNEALQYLRESLEIDQEFGNRAGEATTLNNIAQICAASGRFDEAFQYLRQSLEIQKEIGNQVGEALSTWNLGREYERREEWDTALHYLRRAVALEAELDHPDLEADTEYLKNLEAKLAERSRV